MRTVKQSSVVRETENGEEGEEEGAEFGEEDLFHQQVEVPKVACVAATSPGPCCPAGCCVCAKVLGTVRASPPGGPHSLWPEMCHGGAGGGGRHPSLLALAHREGLRVPARGPPRSAVLAPERRQAAPV